MEYKHPIILNNDNNKYTVIMNVFDKYNKCGYSNSQISSLLRFIIRVQQQDMCIYSVYNKSRELLRILLICSVL